jgi:hypothetical protein
MNEREAAVAAQRPTVEYEPPRVETLGSFVDLTGTCFYDKKLGTPDYWSFVPIAWCSS